MGPQEIDATKRLILSAFASFRQREASPLPVAIDGLLGGFAAAGGANDKFRDAT
jgi:hypothetical protein